MPSKRDDDPEIKTASTGKMFGIIETTSPLSPPREVIAATSNIKLSISDNDFKNERVDQLGVTQDEESLLKETERLWNRCKTILGDFTRKSEAEGFLEPVDWRKLKLPLYPNIIKNPMDLGTIKRKLVKSKYASIFQFDKDMRLVWSNAKKFNGAGSNIYRSAEFLRREWIVTFRNLKKDPVVSKLWARKARRSRPKRSPRSNIEEHLVSDWNKHIIKEPTNTVAMTSSIDQRPKRQHEDTFSLIKSPYSSQPGLWNVVGKQSTRCPGTLSKALPLTPPNLSPGRNRRRQTHVCFKWRRGHCRKGVMCPYKHYEKNVIHKKGSEKTQKIRRSPTEGEGSG